MPSFNHRVCGGCGLKMTKLAEFTFKFLKTHNVNFLDSYIKNTTYFACIFLLFFFFKLVSGRTLFMSRKQLLQLAVYFYLSPSLFIVAKVEGYCTKFCEDKSDKMKQPDRNAADNWPSGRKQIQI